MIPRRLYAQALALSAVMSGSAAFLLHTPCRNSGYGDGVFNTLCYSDFAVLFAEPATADFHKFAPIPSLILQAIATLPVDWMMQLLFLQVLLFGFLATAGLAIFRSNLYSDKTAIHFLLLPIWPFVIFVADDFIAAFFMLLSLLSWRLGKYKSAGVLAGLALASGAWTWVLLLAYSVIARRYEAWKILRKVTVIALAVALVFSFTRILQGAPLLVPLDFTAGEGTFNYVWALTNRAPLPSNLIFVLSGIAVLFALAQHFEYLAFDFHIEPVLVIFLSISVLSAISISPQHLIHLAWLLPLWRQNFKFNFAISVLLIGYLVAVWLRFENTLENARGIPDIPYALFGIGLWCLLTWMSYRAYLSMAKPGVDAGAQAR